MTFKSTDVSHITQMDPAPILHAIGWRPNPKKSRSWISGDTVYSVFKARTGDWLCKPFPDGKTGNALHMLREAEGLSFPAAIVRAEQILADNPDMTAETLLGGGDLDEIMNQISDKPEPRRIDAEAVKVADPSPILHELGYAPDAGEKGKWIGGPLGSLSVFRATRGDGSWLMLSHSNDQTIDVIRLISECRNLSFIDATNLAASILGTNTPALSSSPCHNLTSQTPAGPEPARKISSAEATERYYRGGTEWSLGNPVPDVLQRRGITSLPIKWSDAFVVSDRGSVRTPFRGSDSGHITGFESIQADGSKHLLSGSTIGIVTSRLEHADEIVVTESLIDAISHDLLHGPSARGYIVVRSGAEDYVVEQIAGLIKIGMPINRVTISTDNDAAGMVYSGKIMARIDRLRISDKHPKDPDRFIEKDFEVLYVPPMGRCNDHNDALQLALRSPDTKAGRRLQDYLDQLSEDAVYSSPAMAAE